MMHHRSTDVGDVLILAEVLVYFVLLGVLLLGGIGLANYFAHL